MFGKAMAALRIAAQSPDGLVRVGFMPSHGLRVLLDPAVPDVHNESSVEPQVESALGRAVAGYHRALTRITEQEFGSQRARAIERLPRRMAIDRAIDDAEVTTTSPRRRVSVGWSGRDRFTVVLAPGSLRQVPLHELTDELNNVLVSVARERDEEIARLRHRIDAEEKARHE